MVARLYWIPIRVIGLPPKPPTILFQLQTKLEFHFQSSISLHYKPSHPPISHDSSKTGQSNALCLSNHGISTRRTKSVTSQVVCGSSNTASVPWIPGYPAVPLQSQLPVRLLLGKVFIIAQSYHAPISKSSRPTDEQIIFESC